MKKYAFLLVAGLFVLAGCGKSNQVVCTQSGKEAGVDMKATIKASIKDDKVSKVTAEVNFNDKSVAEQYCSLLNAASSLSDEKVGISCKGKTIVFDDAEEVIGEDLVGLAKDEFISMATEEGFTCK